MEHVLEQVKTAVAGYSPKEEGNHQKTLRDLLAAISACLQYVNENSQTDRGCAQRMVRELEEILANFPSFARFASDKKELNRLHTKQLAEEHIKLIEDHFAELVKNEDKAEQKQIHRWVKEHPVFGELKKNIKKASPKGSYVLLFREAADGLELVTHTTEDGRVFTRIRPHEFRDDIKLHQAYLDKPAIVGAALIVDKDLLAVVGKVPPPDEVKADEAEQKQAQLQKLLSISSKAAGKPALEFIQFNDVLKELHEMSRRRKFPKDSYVLLFQKQGAVQPTESTSTSAEQDLDLESNEDTVAVATESEETAADTSLESEELTETTESDVIVDEQISEDISLEDGATEEVADEAETSEEMQESEIASAETEDLNSQAEEAISGITTFENSDSEEAPDSSADDAPVAKHVYAADLEIVVKKSNDGKIISRFWPVDFAIRHKLFDTFRDKPSIVGAAIIKHTELVQAIGMVPQPAEGQTDLAAFMSISRMAVEKPFADFVADNPVLKGLNDFATGEKGAKESHVILFTQTEGSKLEILSVPRDRGKPIARIPISDFKNAKVLHERFAGKSVVGASVISGGIPSHKRHNDRYDRQNDRYDRQNTQGHGNKRPADGQRGRTQVVDARPVVLAAFGKTPLRESLLATPENLQRFGINV